MLSNTRAERHEAGIFALDTVLCSLRRRSSMLVMQHGEGKEHRAIRELATYVRIFVQTCVIQARGKKLVFCTSYNTQIQFRCVQYTNPLGDR